MFEKLQKVAQTTDDIRRLTDNADSRLNPRKGRFSDHFTNRCSGKRIGHVSWRKPIRNSLGHCFKAYFQKNPAYRRNLIS